MPKRDVAVDLWSTGPKTARTAVVWAALITVYVLWGSTYLGIRVAVETMPPFLMAGVRFVIAGLILCAWRLPSALASGRAPTATQWRKAAVIGAALLIGGNGAVAWAEQVVPSGLTAVMVSIVPLWMALIDRVFFGRKISAPTAVGLIVGFAGVALLVFHPSTGSIPIVGALVLAGGSLSWAAGSLYARDAKLPEDSLLSTGMEMATGGIGLCLLGLLTGEASRVHLSAISTASWAGFVYLVIFGAIVGYSAYLWVIRNAPTTLVSTYAYVNPIVAVLLGLAILHEPISTREGIAGAVIIAAVALIVSTGSSQLRRVGRLEVRNGPDQPARDAALHNIRESAGE